MLARLVMNSASFCSSVIGPNFSRRCQNCVFNAANASLILFITNFYPRHPKALSSRKFSLPCSIPMLHFVTTIWHSFRGSNGSDCSCARAFGAPISIANLILVAQALVSLVSGLPIMVAHYFNDSLGA